MGIPKGRSHLGGGIGGAPTAPKNGGYGGLNKTLSVVYLVKSSTTIPTVNPNFSARPEFISMAYIAGALDW